jgi:hypothetical protein
VCLVYRGRVSAAKPANQVRKLAVIAKATQSRDREIRPKCVVWKVIVGELINHVLKSDALMARNSFWNISAGVE